VKGAGKIMMRAINALIPYASNARTHSDAQIAQIAASIREFGFTNPVLVDGEQGIIAGHGRVLAARKLGMDQIPTIELAYLSETQRQAYIIADNKLAENAGWDHEMLRLELGDLKELGFDLALTGFDDVELGAMLKDRSSATGDGASKLHDGLSYQIIVECAHEQDQAEMLEDFRARGVKCRPLIL
jgi:ParB-like chromosome segregation protein Spo0J